MGINVLVCGGRKFGIFDEDDNEVIRKEANLQIDLLNRILDRIHKEERILKVIQGGAPGADTLAKKWANKNDAFTETYSPNWKKYGRAAGPIRNQLMLDSENIDLVVAFPGGRGTKDMVNRAEKAQKRIMIINPNLVKEHNNE